MEFLVIGVLGLIVGLLVAKLFLMVSMRKSIGLQIVSVLLGILGALSADQLVDWGPDIFNVQIVPVLVGGMVLSLVGIYFYYQAKKFVLNLRK